MVQFPRHLRILAGRMQLEKDSPSPRPSPPRRGRIRARRFERSRFSVFEPVERRLEKSTSAGLALLRLFAFCYLGLAPFAAHTEEPTVRSFEVKGTVEEVRAERKSVIIRHEAIPNYMDAMTMPFKVREAKELSALRKGDAVSFRLHVGDSESWIDQITKVGTGTVGSTVEAGKMDSTALSAARPRHPLMNYKFTNELGQAVSLADFHG